MVINLTTAAPRAPATHCPDFIISANSPLLCDDVNNTGEEVVVSIKDTGIGIDSEILPKLFTKFATKSDIGGTGLGLFIAKSIVESHGGKIWAENNANGKGATFSFSLPSVI
jgi:signal transduction histidine kinase